LPDSFHPIAYTVLSPQRDEIFCQDFPFQITQWFTTPDPLRFGLILVYVLVHMDPTALILKFWVNQTSSSGIAAPQKFS